MNEGNELKNKPAAINKMKYKHKWRITTTYTVAKSHVAHLNIYFTIEDLVETSSAFFFSFPLHYVALVEVNTQDLQSLHPCRTIQFTGNKI